MASSNSGSGSGSGSGSSGTTYKPISTGGFPKSLKAGSGGSTGMDLSHKVSAKQTDVMFQAVSQDPSQLQAVLPSVTSATTTPSTVAKRVNVSATYLSQHPPYTSAPMSPKSQQATRVVFNAFANQNANNLRPEDSSENRSIGEFPHFNVSQGQMSPRSSTLNAAVSVFETHYGPQLPPQALELTQSYTQFQQRINTYGTNFSTSDQMQYASDVRNHQF